jgi:anti-sigma factor RsiW
MNRKNFNSAKPNAHCSMIARRLGEYIDGALDNDLTWKIKNHLAICPECSSAAASLSAVSRILASATRLEVSKTFDASLEARLLAVSQQRARVSIGDTIVDRLKMVWSRGAGYPARWSAPMAAIASVAVFAAIFLHPASSPTVPRAAVRPLIASVTTANDTSVMQACLNQHRSDATADPMSDTSAQMLTASVDNLPADPSQHHNLSDEDAAVLLDEEI